MFSILVQEGTDVCDHVLSDWQVFKNVLFISYPGKHLTCMSTINPSTNPLGGGFVMSLYGTCKLGAAH